MQTSNLQHADGVDEARDERNDLGTGHGADGHCSALCAGRGGGSGSLGDVGSGGDAHALAGAQQGGVGHKRLQLDGLCADLGLVAGNLGGVTVKLFVL